IEYSVTANRAVLDFASRYRETLLFNIWRMGMNSIERGSRDHWTHYPSRLDSVRAAMERARPVAASEDAAAWGGAGGQPGAEESAKYWSMLRDPALRGPRGYILPADQPDFLTATKFVNALIRAGIKTGRA